MTDQSTPSPAATVYYDGGCPICSREIALYRRRDVAGRIRWQDLRAEPIAANGDGPDQETALARFHLRRADGVWLSGAAAFAALWSIVPGFKTLGALARLPGMIWVLELAYRGFLRVRPRPAGAVCSDGCRSA
jgi:predicted DCC family thiol-disulfide oxidoreductase YuxK